MHTWDVALIRSLMLDAGRTALEHFGNPDIETKPDASLVTAADHAIERFFIESLVSDEDSVLIGEETSAGMDQATIDRAMEGVAWIVDPIDGTAPFANGLANWGVSLARAEGGVITDGALFLPRTGELFMTDGETVLYKLGARNPDYWSFDDMETLEPIEIPYRSSGMVSLPHEVVFRARYTGANPMQSIGSAVYSVAQVIRGNYLCYVARVKLWDLAGSIPILRRLGFRLVYADGRDVNERIEASLWDLDAGSPRVWKAHDLMLIASSDQTVNYLQEHFSVAERR